MTEFGNGMYEALKKIAGTSSLALAIIFFIGHVRIAMTVVLVEPAVNSIWFFVLHKVWNKLQND